MSALLEAINLERMVSEVFTLGTLDIKINRGDTVALIGPNGAGKTTFFQLITGNSDATNGEIRFRAEKFRPENFLAKRSMGYLSQDVNLPQWVTPKELLNYSASLHGIKDPEKKISEQISKWQIESYINRPLASCSHGMKKRAGIASALLHNPEFLILDEPFAGLDILHIKSLKDTIIERGQKGLTTIVSTHILPYASELCDKALTIKDGKINEIIEWRNMDSASQQQTIEKHFYLDQET